MPFISKDWRSPGEAWVKTQEGWQKKKVLEHCRTIKERSDNCEETENSETAIQPHCHITIKSTKEIAGFNELDEAVKRLDFRSAVRDVRRFNYICALLDLLIGQQMTALSGCAQKVLLAMLEEVASHATTSQHNPRGFRQLLNNLRALRAAERSACWGGPLGSQLLWHQHTVKIERILNMAAQMQIREPSPDMQPKLLQLPEECIREIILRLSDHRDLISSAQSCEQMASIVGEQRVWRELTKFHFTPQQIDLVLPKDNEKIDWKNIYHTLKKTFGLNEDRQYAEMLSLCRYCRCLFWRSLGHPCIADQCPEYRARLQEAGGITPPSPVPPSAFLKFFSL
ncbi:F-box only protein 25 [Anoplophora glabripennis]|uniref:F-box only protein 25 n=1 Tax=Anoplophora glabripennis TaxID=217634 RepID=UPI0008752388|nr:F-box only protein 25 [Anoplophora glabripennis]